MDDLFTLQRLKYPFEARVVNEGTKTFIAYYQKNPTFSLREKYNEDPQLIDWEKYTQLFHIQANDLDEVFHHFQGEVWSPKGEGRDLIGFLGLNHTSMSVGDLIRDCAEKKWYIVAPCGFEEVKVVYIPKEGDMVYV